jgi:branched-chain amino acid transport system substrate-binding protein
MNYWFSIISCLAILIGSGCRPAPVSTSPESPQQAPSEIPPESPAPTPAPLKVIDVGVFLPLKGESQGSGGAALNGLVVAAEEINAKGGIDGQLVRLIVRDTKSEADRAGAAVKDLLEVDNVVAVIGGVSAGSDEAAHMANKLKIPMLALGSTMPGIPDKEPWVFRLSSVDFYSGEVMAKFASSLRASTAIVLYDMYSDYARNLATAFGKEFKRKHIVAGEPYDLASRDFSKQLTKIKRKNPEVVYLPAPADQAAEIIKQARLQGLNMPFLGTGSWDSLDFLSAAGDAANNCYAPARFNPEITTESGRAFLAAYALKQTSSPPAMAALGYDALKVLAEALKASGGTDRVELRDALRSIKSFTGLTGVITFNPESLVPNPVSILKADEGTFKFLETIEP